MNISKDCKNESSGDLGEWSFYPTANGGVERAICRACLEIICGPAIEAMTTPGENWDFLWRAYALADDDSLTADALELKKALLTVNDNLFEPRKVDVGAEFVPEPPRPEH